MSNPGGLRWQRIAAMRCAVQLGHTSGDLNLPLGAPSLICATAQNIRRPRSPRFTTPTICLRPLLPASASARALSLLRIVGSIIRSVTARVERGFADFAQIPYEDVSHRELCKFLDEFEGRSLDEPSIAIQRTADCCTHQAHGANPLVGIRKVTRRIIELNILAEERKSHRIGLLRLPSLPRSN
jgi:hypothetical protein